MKNIIYNANVQNVELNRLRKQACVVGAIAFDDVIPTEAQRAELTGVWNLLHAILDQRPEKEEKR